MLPIHSLCQEGTSIPPPDATSCLFKLIRTLALGGAIASLIRLIHDQRYRLPGKVCNCGYPMSGKL